MTGSPNSPAPEDPEIRVTDQYNNSIADVSVTFDVQTGGGNVSAADPPCSAQDSCVLVSDESGRAKLSEWRLGPDFETQTLLAFVTNNTSVEKEFTVNTGSDPCLSPLTFVPGDDDRDDLEPTDCRLDISGETFFSDLFEVDVSSTTQFSVTMTSTDVGPALLSFLYPPSTSFWRLRLSNPGTITSYYVVGPGTYTIAASTFDAEEEGSYEVTSVLNPVLPSDPDECGNYLVTKNINVSHSLSATDCLETHFFGGSATSTRKYLLYLPSGQSATVSMNSTSGIDSFLEAYDVSGSTPVNLRSTSFSPMTISADFSQGRFIEIRATHETYQVPQSGTYTFIINP
jgi:hypothetical protein